MYAACVPRSVNGVGCSLLILVIFLVLLAMIFLFFCHSLQSAMEGVGVSTVSRRRILAAMLASQQMHADLDLDLDDYVDLGHILA